MAAVVLLGSIAAPAHAGAASDITVHAVPSWGPVPPGTWTPYSVRVGNEGGANVDGEVVLAPQPEPAPKPGAPPPRGGGSSPTTVLALGPRVITAPAPQGPGGTTRPSSWPTYRAPITLAPGSEKTLTVMVLEAPFGYRIDVVAQHGGVVASGTGPAPATREPTAVLLLSDVTGAQATLKALPQQVAPNLNVTTLGAAREFPESALGLAGLAAVLIDDFDTATLSRGQVRALQDYVSLGGSLILAGGAAWSRTVGSLPEGLVPLGPSGSAQTSLSPLAELAAGATTATATVATGELRAGRAVVGAPGGPALVVEAEYRAGRVVQLAYDPLAEPIASDPLLRGPAWDQALGRGWGGTWGSSLPPVPEGQLWGSALGVSHWPSWPRPAMWLVVLYALVVGPAAFAVARRRRPAMGWVVLPLAVVLTTGACLMVAGHRVDASEAAVEVRTLGADGTALTTVYRGRRELDPGDVGALPGAAASTVFTRRPVFRSLRGQFDGSTLYDPQIPVARGLGGGTVVSGGDRPAVRQAARPWGLRTVQEVSVDHEGPTLGATLRVARTSDGSAVVVTGSVTNRGSAPIRQLRAQISLGQAHLADELAPGETRTVEAPIDGVRPAPSESGLLPASAEEVTMFAAASEAFTGPDQVALVGLTSPPPKPPGATSRSTRSHLTVVVTVAPLQAADVPLGYAGESRLVSSSPRRGGGTVNILDLSVPAGGGPLSARYGVFDAAEPGVDRFSVEVYSWTAGTWRPLPTARHGLEGTRDSPLEAGEQNEGLVRLRAQAGSGGGVLPFAQLIPTSSGSPR